MTPKRPPAPRTAEPPAGPLSRLRGRHRKPRPRKALLAASGLALAAGAVTLVRLASAPDGIEAEAAPRSAPPTETDAPADAPRPATPTPAAPSPKAGPSSPEVLGSKNSTPVLPPGAPSRPRERIPTPLPETADPPAPTPPKNDEPSPPPGPSPVPEEPPPHRPDGPGAPAPEPDPALDPDPDPGLCIPIIGLCVGGGEPH
ncbi:hypothetical protein ACIF9R_02215 [Streptomyces sp. NPDC086080]|uniref:hypothetical protein n=1 Tax=Streptomyces sp. NPDC086080 TaxID=3365748 RepID=UPI0037D39467